MEALAIEKLKGLHFKISEKNCSSVYFVEDLDKIDEIHPKIAISLDKAKIFGADAVYFRFFEGNRMPIPQVYIYDNTKDQYCSDELVTIHKKIWSASEIPCFIVIGKTSVQVYDSRKPIIIKKGEPSHNTLFGDNIDVDELVKDFNSMLLDTGELWEKRNNDFKYQKTSYQILLDGLHSAKQSIQKAIDINELLLNRILILSILIKYLEENSKDDNNEDLSQKFYKEQIGCSSYVEAIRNHKIVDFFNCLAIHFNGGVFKISEEDSKILKEVDFEILAQFIEGKLDKQNQLLMWEQYSFKHIPFELISNFLEDFIEQDVKKKDGVVYTPSCLVNFLVDECLPLTNEDLNYNVKLIDVSCGSGIFLATAFKRLIERWRVSNKQGAQLGSISIDEIKTILHNNIFGVDINDIATELTKFSLNITLCSMLTPKQIWTELKFDDLNSNIFNKNFYNFIEETDKRFDLVLGNPPFGSLNGKDFKKNYAHKFEVDIYDNQQALMFLYKSMDLLLPNGILCLIQSAGPFLYYDKSFALREYFFRNYNVLQILDFTKLSNSLFNASVSTLAVFVQKALPSKGAILHIPVEKVISNREKNYFELTHYNFHYVPYATAMDKTKQFVWKSNLFGGSRVFNLVNKILNLNFGSLRNFVSKNDMNIGQGFKMGNRSKIDTNEYIVNKNTIRDNDFTEDGIVKIETISNCQKFETIPKNNDIFKGPHLLIKESIGLNKIITELRDDYLSFSNEIIGIHSKNKSNLVYLYNILQENNDLYRFLMITTSNRSIISRSIKSYLAQDFYNLPLALKKEFMLSKSDQIIINDIIEYYLKANTNPIDIDCSIEQLKVFASVYSDALNSIYKQGEQKYSLSTIYDNQSYYALEFCFSESKIVPKVLNNTENLYRLIDNEVSDNLLIKRIIRLYRDNSIILIKPKQLRYWLKSIALRDYDETLAEAFDFINQ